ncbi:hypothetical protein [Vibrio quintilis]|uniref:Uncharacterized protein n=1 Tax=Vibrio quintilis TaxID=1117707 RepID=A0A1M7YU79_9VIBR|nr:hypothetical protein [Vibrio quintilis]SHO56145.1 hypothetical protein VQ7734_01912 [Vibrio quintilis]
MKLHVLITQRTKISFDRLSRKEQMKARQAIEYMEMGNAGALHGQRLAVNHQLYEGKVSNRVRVIYKRNGDDYEIVDFINPQETQKLAQYFIWPSNKLT